MPPTQPGQFVFHYTDGDGRSIEIRRPGSPLSEIPGNEDEPPDAYVLGQPVQIAAVSSALSEPLIVSFSLLGGSPNDPCTSYSLNGYGVTEAEMRRFAESLVQVP